MKAENYLYFAISGDNDTDKDAVMYPASAFRGAVSFSSTTAEYFFDPLDGTGTTANGVLMTFANVADTDSSDDGATGSPVTRNVMEKFCQLASGNRNNTTNFTVIKDLNDNLPTNEGAISASGLTEVTALAITTH